MLICKANIHTYRRTDIIVYRVASLLKREFNFIVAESVFQIISIENIHRRFWFIKWTQCNNHMLTLSMSFQHNGEATLSIVYVRRPTSDQYVIKSFKLSGAFSGVNLTGKLSNCNFSITFSNAFLLYFYRGDRLSSFCCPWT